MLFGLLQQLVGLEPQKLWLADDAVAPMEELRRYLHELEQASAGIAEGFQSFIGKLAGVAGSLALLLTMAMIRIAPRGAKCKRP